MQTLQDLYLQNPVWIWLGVGAVFVALDIASGSGKLIWAGAAGIFLAVVNMMEVRLGAAAEISLFTVCAVGGVVIASAPWKRRASAETAKTSQPAKDAPAKARRTDEPLAVFTCAERTERLVGRIGRTTGEFANGVGRVWIDGREWGAELDGQEALPQDVPVRILRVTGGVRLQVRGLMTS